MFEADGVTLLLGDCRAVMATMEPESVDAIVTDPPYELAFMGKGWDASGVSFQAETWVQAQRVLKPGGHAVIFGGTRTHHRLWCAVEDAGFEIRDCLMWLYGTGFPKSLDVSKAIDKAAGAQREVIGRRTDRAATPVSDFRGGRMHAGGAIPGVLDNSAITAPATVAAREWQGWGTALKPSWESILLARKPFTIDREQAIIVASLTRLEAQLWSLLPVNTAAESFGLSPSEFDEVCGFAQWPADERDSTRAGLLAQMDMSQFVLMMTTCLNTVMSWSHTLAVLLNPVNTSTIGMAIGQTTDWRTLNLFVSALTPVSIIQAEIEAPGSRCGALPAARYLNAVSANIASTQELSVLAPVISNGQAKCQAETAQGFRPNFEPILLCRKPLTGTVAANVQKHGTGAINIDATRIAHNEECRMMAPSQANIDSPSEKCRQAGRREAVLELKPSGRWPANLVLSCTCEETREGRVKAHMPGNTKPVVQGHTGIYGRHVKLPHIGYAGPDGKEAVRIHTDPNCPCAMLDAQSGERASGSGDKTHRVTSAFSASADVTNLPSIGGDSGGASRFFYTSKASSSERGADLTCDCKTVNMEAWVSTESLEQAASMSPPKGISEGRSTGECGSTIPGSGNKQTARSRRGSTSTTKTGTSKTTDLKTSASSAEPTTNGCTEAVKSAMGSGGSPVASADRSNPSPKPTGISPLKVGPSTGVVAPATSALSWKQSVCGICGARIRLSSHPTQKPLALMSWLCRLITPPNGLILDPFVGSGTTAVAARMGGFRCIGIDNNEEYLSHAAERLRMGDEGLSQAVKARRSGAEQGRFDA